MYAYAYWFQNDFCQSQLEEGIFMLVTEVANLSRELGD